MDSSQSDLKVFLFRLGPPFPDIGDEDYGDDPDGPLCLDNDQTGYARK